MRTKSPAISPIWQIEHEPRGFVRGFVLRRLGRPEVGRRHSLVGWDDHEAHLAALGDPLPTGVIKGQGEHVRLSGLDLLELPRAQGMEGSDLPACTFRDSIYAM